MPTGKEEEAIPDNKAVLRDALSSLDIRGKAPATEEEHVTHAFWDTQPVPAMSESTEDVDDSEMGPIDCRAVEDVRKDPYSLPASFQWSDINLDNDEEVKELYTLLHENYVEDGDNMFRFDYSPAFLRWALSPPGFKPEWHVGVRVTQTQKLVAFISCTPALLYCKGVRVQPKPQHLDSAASSAGGGGGGGSSSNAGGASSGSGGSGGVQSPNGDDEAVDLEAVDSSLLGDMSTVEVNFLCVHKKLRSKRLAPVLIKEITRRCNLCGIFQAAYTAGIVLPKPVACCRYYHRSLNPKKLIEVGFSRLAPRMTLTRTIKLYALSEETQTPGLRPIADKDCEVCCQKLNEYLTRFELAPRFTTAEFRHWMLTQTGVVYTYVVEDPDTKEITDMVSFYSLPSSILGNDKHTLLRAAYCYYLFANKTSLTDLLNDALTLAKRLDFDVFNALDVLENDTFLKELKFGIGDGHLQYYLYNWRCAPIKSGDVGLVLL